MIKTPAETKWLIWSNEHNAWWRPDSHGYTTVITEAGRYSFSEAAHICAEANRFLALHIPPSETMLPASEETSRD